MPGSDPITAIANALTQVGALAQPYIEEHLAQKYESEHQTRMAQWLDIMADKDDRSRADRMHAFVLRVLSIAGTPSGDVGNVVVRIPLDTLTALVSECSEGIKKDSILARLQFKQK